MNQTLREEYKKFIYVINTTPNGDARYGIDFTGLEDWIDQHFLSREDVRAAIDQKILQTNKYAIFSELKKTLQLEDT